MDLVIEYRGSGGCAGDDLLEDGWKMPELCSIGDGEVRHLGLALTGSH